MCKAIALVFALLLTTFSVQGASTNVRVTINFPSIDKPARLYNFQVKQYEMIRDPGSLSRDDCLEYLPSTHPKIIAALDHHIDNGQPPFRALVFTLLALNSHLQKQAKRKRG